MIYNIGFTTWGGRTSISKRLLYLFRKRVTDDGGLIDDQEDVRSYISMAKANGIYDSIKFGMLDAYNIRTSGNTKYVTKAYSLDAVPNDATQTTESLQPYLTGFIAPNEKWGLKNPNGGERYVTHPTISFAANEAWSVSTVVNYTGGSLPTEEIFGSPLIGALRIKYINAYVFRFVNDSLNAGQISYSTNLLGKNYILTITATGDGNIVFYINGIIIGNISIASNISFSNILRGREFNCSSSISSHFIRNIALTPTQVAAEAAKLRQIFPEIPSVTIGSQIWSSSNFEAVTTPMGNVIANVTDNTAWSNSQATYDSVYAATVGTDEQKTYAAVKAAAMWSYYNNDASLGAIYGKLYNWFAVKLLQMDIDYYNSANPSTPWGWRVPTQTDFNTLATTIGGASVAGGKMKVAGTNYWNSPNTGADNSSGFSLLGVGNRNVDGVFASLGTVGNAWNIDAGRFFCLYNSSAITIQSNPGNKFGFSLRLIKS